MSTMFELRVAIPHCFPPNTSSSCIRIPGSRPRLPSPVTIDDNDCRKTVVSLGEKENILETFLEDPPRIQMWEFLHTILNFHACVSSTIQNREIPIGSSNFPKTRRLCRAFLPLKLNKDSLFPFRLESHV